MSTRGRSGRVAVESHRASRRYRHLRFGEMHLLTGAVFLIAAFFLMVGVVGCDTPAPARHQTVSVIGMSAPSSSESTAAAATSTPTAHGYATVGLSAVDSSSAPKGRVEPSMVVAWQPSHQADTGRDGWEEYTVCGDIVDRTMAELPEFKHVKAWDTEHGLTGSNNYRPRPSNTGAFDRELRIANDADVTVFISVHNDGAAPSGILGECMPSDQKSQALCVALVTGLTHRLHMKNRGVREVRLYSLEATRNHAEYRCLLEVGDNAADRKLLESARGRQLIAEALAESLRGFDFSE